MKENLANYSLDPSRTVGMSQENLSQAIGKLSGYNAGMEKALSTFQEIIVVLFATQVIQVFTHRLLYRDRPFAVTVNDPVSGEKLWTWGSDRQLSDKSRRVVKLIDQASFTVGIAIAAFMFVQLYVPAYTWEVSTVWG